DVHVAQDLQKVAMLVRYSDVNDDVTSDRLVGNVQQAVEPLGIPGSQICSPIRRHRNMVCSDKVEGVRIRRCGLPNINWNRNVWDAIDDINRDLDGIYRDKEEILKHVIGGEFQAKKSRWTDMAGRIVVGGLVPLLRFGRNDKSARSHYVGFEAA